MKKSINAWSVPSQLTFEETFQAVSEAGFEGIELNLDAEGASAHAFSLSSGEADYDKVKALSQKYHLPVGSISTSLYGANPLGSDCPDARERGKNVLRKQLEIAKALGADGILAVPGGLSDTVSLLQAHQNAAASLRELIPEIEASGVKVGLENVWNGFFMSPFDMRAFIDELGSPSIGAYFDVGNVVVTSAPEHWIEILGSRIVKIHVKDYKRDGRIYTGGWVNLLEGSTNWDKVVHALRAAGYDGYITAELPVIGWSPEYLYTSTVKALEIIFQM